jgi:hypothetical protein
VQAIKKGFLAVLNWIKIQIDWVKGFFEEQLPDGKMKPSQKRLVSFFVVLTFLYSYVYVLVKKTDALGKISEITFPDMPMNWAFLIGFIIGANIYSNIQSSKAITEMTKVKNNTQEVSQKGSNDKNLKAE